jgi:hypothetical protein
MTIYTRHGATAQRVITSSALFWRGRETGEESASAEVSVADLQRQWERHFFGVLHLSRLFRAGMSGRVMSIN